MEKQRKVAAGMVIAAIWVLPVLWLGFSWGHWIEPLPAIMLAGLPGGIVMLTMVARLAAGRFFSPGNIDGEAFAPGSTEEITQRVLTNTTEQLILAAAIWPAAGVLFGPGLPAALGISFGLTRIAFWLGYLKSPPLRAFGFAAGFYPTVVCAVLSAIMGLGRVIF